VGARTFLVAGGVDVMTLEKRFNGSGFRVQRLTPELLNFTLNKPMYPVLSTANFSVQNYLRILRVVNLEPLNPEP